MLGAMRACGCTFWMMPIRSRSECRMLEPLLLGSRPGSSPRARRDTWCMGEYSRAPYSMSGARIGPAWVCALLALATPSKATAERKHVAQRA